jgi:hypothetical protein
MPDNIDCGSMGKLLSMYDDPLLASEKDLVNTLFTSPILYIAITGILQVLASVAVILLVLSYLDGSNRYIWTRVILALLFLSFAFNFTIATSTSMNSTFYNQFWKKYLDSIEAYMSGFMGSFVRDFVKALRQFMNFTTAEAVLTFVLTLPLIAVTVVALLDQSLKEEVDNVPTTPTIRDSAVEFHQRNDIVS